MRPAASPTGLALLAALSLAACAHASDPEAVAQRYREAWRRSDARTLRDLSTPEFQARVDEARLANHLDATRGGLSATQTSTAALVSARLRFSDGLELELLRHQGAWRVVSGGPDPDEVEGPLGALRRFLSAVVVEDLAQVRRFIPSAARDRFTSDEVLRAHLTERGDRVRELLRALSAGLPEVRETEDGVEVRYAPGRAARLRLEDRKWCVLDLE